MHGITRSCVLFLWIQTLTLVQSQDCTRQQFFNSPLFDANFDTTSLEASYSPGRQVRVGCNVGFSGFFKLICTGGKWESKGTKCQLRSCGHPGDAQFADFQLQEGDDFVFGSKVVYTCQTGYQMVSRSNSRRCMAEGWDGNVPVCEARQCPVIHVNDNVLVTGDPEEATYGNVLGFRCKSNTQVLNGLPEIYCDENGDWSSKEPTCEEIKCSVPVINNGRITGELRDYSENEVLHFECDDKFQKQREILSKCIKQGNSAAFSPAPVCEPIKCKLPTRLRGSSYDPQYKMLFDPGERVTVNCGDKYYITTPLITSATSTCQDNGNWDITPLCQEVRCRSERGPNVNYWRPRWGVIRLDDTVSYNCQTGYRAKSSQATCTRDGWTPEPLCEAIPCTKKTVWNANIVSNEKESYIYPEEVRYVCKDGYEGTFTLTCMGNRWDGNARCTEKRCQKKVIPGADIFYNDRRIYDHNQQVTYRCQEDQTQEFTVTCQKGDWTGVQSCQEKRCQKKVIPGADIIYNDRRIYDHNQQVTYRCQEDQTQEFTVTCQKGDWTGVQSCQEKRCQKKVIPGADIIYNDRRIYGHNQQVTYRCQEDQTQEFTVTCQKGDWTGVQSCQECPKIQIANGFVVAEEDDKAYYTCYEGYKLFTNGWWGEAICIRKQWTGLEACIENSRCGEPPVIANGRVTPQGTRTRPTLRLNCDDGFDAQVERLTCVGGNWYFGGFSPETLCAHSTKSCNPPPRVENAVIKASFQKQYLSGSAVTYVCRDEYRAEGEDRIRCRNGQWEQNNFICTPVPDPKAAVSDLEALPADLDSKAAVSDLGALPADPVPKAAVSDLEALPADLDPKAAVSDLGALPADPDPKAAVSDLEALPADLDPKAVVSDLEAVPDPTMEQD